jgi:hypothetical protein
VSRYELSVKCQSASAAADGRHQTSLISEEKVVRPGAHEKGWTLKFSGIAA